MILSVHDVTLKLRLSFDSSGRVFYRSEFINGSETKVTYADNSFKVLDPVNEYLFETIFKPLKYK